MLEGKRFVCDFCKDPIEAEDVVEVESVDRNCCGTREVIRHLHLYIDGSSRYSRHNGGRGCYNEWIDSDDGFTPHGVRRVPKKEILENLHPTN